MRHTDNGLNAPGLALLLLALVGPSFTFVALPPVLPDIAAHFGGGAGGQGIAQMTQALPFLGLAFGGLLAGWVLLTLGPRISVAVSGVGLIMAGLGGLISDRAPLLLVSCALLGLVTALATSTLAALTSASIKGEKRDRILGVQVAISDACTVAGGISAALLAARLGWHGPFIIFLAFGAVLLLLLAPARMDPLEQADSSGGLAKVAATAWPVYLGAGFVFLLATTQATQLPFYLEQVGYHTVASRAVFITSAVVATMCGSVFFALALGRIAEWLIQLIGVMAAFTGFCGLGYWDGAFGSGFAFILCTGFGAGLTIPTLFAGALRRSPPGLEGHSIGLLNVAIFAGSFVSPVLLSPVALWGGYQRLYGILAIIALIVGAIRVLKMRSKVRAAEVPGKEGIHVHG